jgi:hypothetical protein
MKTELINQYEHSWRVFEGIVRDFDTDAWIHIGSGTTTPARMAFHILKGVKYYLEDSSTIAFASGKSFEFDWETVDEVVIFLLRHSLYHIGELSSLLNESKNGVAEDNWVKAL